MSGGYNTLHAQGWTRLDWWANPPLSSERSHSLSFHSITCTAAEIGFSFTKARVSMQHAARDMAVSSVSELMSERWHFFSEYQLTNSFLPAEQHSYASIYLQQY